MEKLNENFLESIQALFEECIDKYKTSSLEDKYVRYFDTRGRLWQFNNTEGIIHFLIANQEHHLYTKMINNFGEIIETVGGVISSVVNPCDVMN